MRMFANLCPILYCNTCFQYFKSQRIHLEKFQSNCSPFSDRYWQHYAHKCYHNEAQDEESCTFIVLVVGKPNQPSIVRGIYFRWIWIECSPPCACLVISPSHMKPNVFRSRWQRWQLEICGLAMSCLRLPDIEPYVMRGSAAFTSKADAVNLIYYYLMYIFSLPIGWWHLTFLKIIYRLYFLGCWTQDSRVVGSIPTLGVVRLWGLGNFIYPGLLQYNQLQMSINLVGKVPAIVLQPVNAFKGSTCGTIASCVLTVLPTYQC